MLMRTDPFRELDRLTQQVFGTNGTLARPSVMPMDAWRDGDTFHVEFDLPGVNPDSIDLDVERNVVTVKAERPAARQRRRADRRRTPARGVQPAADPRRQPRTPSTSRPATTPACSPCRSRSPSRPSPARSRSPATVRTGRPSTPDRATGIRRRGGCDLRATPSSSHGVRAVSAPADVLHRVARRFLDTFHGALGRLGQVRLDVLDDLLRGLGELARHGAVAGFLSLVLDRLDRVPLDVGGR